MNIAFDTKSDIFEIYTIWTYTIVQNYVSFYLIPDPGFSFYTNKYQSHSYTLGCSMQ